MRNILQLDNREHKLTCYITSLLDEDQLCTGIEPISAAEATANSIPEVLIHCDQKEPVCPNCSKLGRRMVINKDGHCKGTRKEVFLKDGRQVRLTLVQQRLKCDCGKVFYSNVPKLLQPGAQAKRAAYRSIEEGDLVLAPNPDGVAFSKAEGSMMLNEVLKAIWDVAAGNRTALDEFEQRAADKFRRIMSYKPCHTLFFVPFPFGGMTRCCVCGLSGSTAYLLDILESASAWNIDDCVSKRVMDKDYVRCVYCFVDDDVVGVMQHHFRYADIRYSRKCLQDFVRICCVDLDDPELSPKSSLRNRIMRIIKNETLIGYPHAFQHWWFDLRDDLRKRAVLIHDRFCHDTYRYITDKTFEKPYDSSSFASLLAWIKENGNSSFLVMKSRMLLNHDIQSGGITLNMMTAMSHKQPIYHFGVPVNNLLKDRERYHQLMERLFGKKFSSSAATVDVQSCEYIE